MGLLNTASQNWYISTNYGANIITLLIIPQIITKFLGTHEECLGNKGRHY
jgi:hypothetical protein